MAREEGEKIMMGYYGLGTLGWVGMIIGMVLTVAVIVAVIVLIVWAVRRMSVSPSKSSMQSPNMPGAKEIAQARYARGEINRDEYQRLFSDLEH